MRKLSSLILLALLPLMASAYDADDWQKLVIWQTDGTQTSLLLAERPVVKFVADRLTVASSTVDIDMEALDVLRFTYEKEITGIAETGAIVGHSFGQGTLIISGAKINSVGVYTSNGRKIVAGVFQNGDSVVVNLENLPTGVYIVSVGKSSFKILRP